VNFIFHKIIKMAGLIIGVALATNFQPMQAAETTIIRRFLFTAFELLCLSRTAPQKNLSVTTALHFIFGRNFN